MEIPSFIRHKLSTVRENPHSILFPFRDLNRWLNIKLFTAFYDGGIDVMDRDWDNPC